MSSNRLPRPARTPVAPASRQRGTVLLIALVLLGLMMLLARSGIDTGIVQEKVAANSRDRAASFEKAETTLRNAFDTTRWLTNTGKSQPDDSPGYYRSAAIADATSGAVGTVDSASSDYWHGTRMTAANSRQESLPLQTSSTSGRFIIERYRFDDESEPGTPSVYSLNYNGVTVQGQGRIGATTTLQSTLLTLPR